MDWREANFVNSIEENVLILVQSLTQEIRLGLHRSDYMLDEQTKLLLQIELNTISSSFPGLSCLVNELQRLSILWNLHLKSY